MTSRNRSRFLDLKALATVAHMRFTTRQRLDGAYSGRHRSRQQGGAGEFVEFREYTGGEDLRRLDWKVLARTGKAFVRLHQDETSLRCMLALDVSGSMNFGDSRGGDGPSTKLAYAQYLATALSYVIGLSQDQVALAVLDEELRDWIAPGSTPQHIARIQDKIERIESRPAKQMAGALADLFKRVQRRGVLLLMSDFLMEDVVDLFQQVRLFRHRGSEAIALHLVHPGEEQLPEGGAFRFDGMEQEGFVSCSPLEIRAAYSQRFAAHLAAIRQLALSVGCDYHLVSTGVPYFQTLQKFLVERVG